MERHVTVPSPSQEGGETPDEGMSPAEEDPGQSGLDCHGLCRETLHANKHITFLRNIAQLRTYAILATYLFQSFVITTINKFEYLFIYVRCFIHSTRLLSSLIQHRNNNFYICFWETVN